MSHRRALSWWARRHDDCELTLEELEALEELEELGIGLRDGFHVVRDLDAYDPDVEPYYNHLED